MCMHRERDSYGSPPLLLSPSLVWHLASPAGPDLLPGSLGFGTPLPSLGTLLPSPSGCLHTASPSPPPGTDLQRLVLAPSPCLSILGCGVWAVVQMICAALTPRSSHCAFAGGFEFPLFLLIPLSIRWLPRVWAPFLFLSSLSEF